MIFNIPVGGKRTAAVSVYGAVGETITLTHSDGTVYTASNGGALELPVGTYTVKGGTSGYSKSVTVVRKTTRINAYPDGAVYWYGREVQPMLALANNTFGYINATKYTGYVELRAQAQYEKGVSAASASLLTQNTIDLSKWTTIKFVANYVSSSGSNGYKKANFGYIDNTNNANGELTGLQLSSPTGTKSTYSVPAPDLTRYVGAQAYASWNGYQGLKDSRVYVYAIWLE